MAGLAWFINLIALIAIDVVGASAEETAINYRHERQSDDPNIFGVASVARVTSRNGRISSTGGIHFYPGPGPNEANNFIPATFVKAIDDKYVKGSIQIHPGALGVSSSAQAGHIEGLNWPMGWLRQWPEWPVQSQAYTSFKAPWVNRVKLELPQTKMRQLRQQWVYPSFNPFLNFWR